MRSPRRSAVVGDLVVEDLHGPAQCRHPLFQGGTALAKEGDPVLRRVLAAQDGDEPPQVRDAEAGLAEARDQADPEDVFLRVLPAPAGGTPDRADEPFALVVAQRVDGDAGAVGGRGPG